MDSFYNYTDAGRNLSLKILHQLIFYIAQRLHAHSTLRLQSKHSGKQLCKLIHVRNLINNCILFYSK
jgi:hypothetical protein